MLKLMYKWNSKLKLKINFIEKANFDQNIFSNERISFDEKNYMKSRSTETTSPE